jgi:hypothetical protein
MKALLIVAVGLTALVQSSQLAALSHPDYGVVTSVQFLDGVSLARLQQLGAGAVRIGIGWNMVEQTKGHFDFDQIQQWVDHAHAAGLKIFVTLGDPPGWAAPCAACMPDDLWAWYTYVYQVILRFRYLGDDITFGIWNEPNLAQFLNPPQPDLYGDLFDYADLARLDANPRARLAGPDTDHGAAGSGWLSAALVRMNRRLQPKDVLTVHWYPGTRSPDLQQYMQNVLDLANTRETWLTETGKKAIDDLDQQQGLLAILAAFNHRPSAQWAKIFVYRLAGGDPTDPDAPYQLLRPDATMSTRPAFDTYSANMYRALTVSLQASNGQFVVAESNGGSVVHANRARAGAWETFELDDLNGGELQTGDLVRIKTSLGVAVRVATTNKPLEATDWCSCSPASLFVVTALDGGLVGDGDRLALRSSMTGAVVSADRGGGGDVLANRSAIGPWETFRLTRH